MVSPIVAVGAQPLFFPIDSHGAPRLDIIARLPLGNVRAMLAAHYFGLPQPMARIRQFCDSAGMALIEDCAHALFGISDGRPVGSWGDYAIASLTKFLPVTDGGSLAINVPGSEPRAPDRRPIRRQLKSFANAIEMGAQRGKLPGINAPIKALFAVADRVRGRDGRRSQPLTDMQGPSTVSGAMGYPASTHIDSSDASTWAKWIARTAHRDRIVSLRRRNYAYLASELAAIPGVRVLAPQLTTNAAPYVFPLWAERPEDSYMTIRASGIPIFRWDQVWPGTPSGKGDYGTEWATHVFQLGCHQDLELKDLTAMVSRLRHIITGDDRPGRRRDTAS
jgi:dTDP-4-amino-4,6-dideoxygalactose transaminase